jgi:hypothetical protein
MRRTFLAGLLVVLAAAALSAWLQGCGRRAARPISTGPEAERACLVRVMYFESNRSSRAGLLAVGTVVMNRVADPRFPNTICGVVGQPRQFARGALTKPVDPRQLPLAERAADAILAGYRYRPVGDAMWFHAAWLKIPYKVQYTTVAGGNAFYRRTGRYWRSATTTGSIPVSAKPPAGDAGETDQKPDLINRLLRRTATASAVPCETVAGFGATSLACASDMEGR